MDSETIRRGLTAMENIANYLRGIDTSLFEIKTALIEEAEATEQREVDLLRGLLQRLYDVSQPIDDPIDERAEADKVYEAVEKVLGIEGDEPAQWIDGGVVDGSTRPA